MASSSAQAHQLATPGLHNLTTRQLLGTLTGLLLTLLLAALDQTIVGTAMPRIIAELNGFDRYPWVTTAYLLTSTISVPIFAKLSDMWGRKWFFLSGSVLFVLASALCGAAGKVGWMYGDGMTQLIIFRGLQGVGAGIIVGLLFTIIGDIFAPAERARYQGLFAAVWGLASIFGPTLGGWITDHFSWRWVFYVNLPVGALAIGAILVEFPYFRPHGVRRSIDWVGVGALMACLVPLLLALTWVSDYGWTSPRVLWLLGVAAAMLVAFLFAESRASEPLLPLWLFREPVIAVSSVAIFLLGVGMFGVILYVPLFMQGVLGVTATRSGSLLTPLLMAAVVSSVAAGQIIARTGRYRWVAVGGAAIAAVGMYLLAIMNASTTEAQVIWYMIIAGVGIGILQPIYTLAVQNVSPPQHMGAATASTQFFRSIGSTVGVAVFGSVLLSLYHREFQANLPKGTPPRALVPFQNPLQLVQIRSLLEKSFGRYPGGTDLLHKLLHNVRDALVVGLHEIFLIGAILMTVSVIVNLMLREVPLRKKHPGAASIPEG
ncbi:MAG TPA: MDR family MFS transporter [Bryobacteraceae bacterium]|nr:MDR family MFS transporter [Bryobacteraceae bacterium]